MEKGRKRKMESEEGEEDEEEQMQKFYALIRSTMDMRDRLRNIPDGSKEREEERKAAAWNPTFQPEDFMEDDKSKDPIPTPTQAGPSSKTEQQQEDETKEKGESRGIDLNLSL
ncbi:hypothetical protein SLA2020_171790 [Shorea laevis]